jgi:hypothetical protein
MEVHPTAILLDANLLLLITVGMYDPGLIGRKRLDTFSVDDFELLQAFLATFPQNLTTPHLIAEVSNLADQCVPKRQHRQFREFLREHFKQFDEHWMTSTELAGTEAFLRLGLSDAAVCQLAGQHQRTVVFSVDAELCMMLWNLGLSAENFNHRR